MTGAAAELLDSTPIPTGLVVRTTLRPWDPWGLGSKSMPVTPVVRLTPRLIPRVGVNGVPLTPTPTPTP
eukprot:CAMPEP_0173373752 /NCGR_PEP_ID=MMETSP1144-20121109/28678_1 /TAXON_ID=483371 /ORGANISM="non described non described, Strain CCMP2298" /LENGTH=68 /DNA_ID=CAMNT_0014325973 /DNA_START=680 /DNA_END=883 /DNA_ORIENTATION=+